MEKLYKRKLSYGLLILFIFLILPVGSVLAITGGLNVAITPKISEAPIGSSYDLNLTIISTQDFDDTLNVTVTTDGIPESWKADLLWFDWTSREEQINAGETLEIPFPVNIPADVSLSYEAFRIIARSGRTGQEAYDTGMLSIVEPQPTTTPTPTPSPTPTPTPTPPPKEPVLWVGPLEIEVCLNPNETTTKTFQIANVGNGSLENVSIVEPTTLWMDVISGTGLGDMAPGENRTIEVQFNSYNEGVGDHYGKLEVVSDNHPTVDLDVHADITTMPNGTVVFYVQDAYGQSVAGADITLVNQENYDSRTNLTDGHGAVIFVSVPKGDYTYYVYSPNPEHYPSLGTIYMPPTEGCVGCQDVNVTLYMSYIDFEWNVTPTTIQDKYFIMLNLTFETDIPVPILVVFPPRIDEIIEPCGETNGTLKLMNLGLISLFNVTLSPIEMDNGLTIEFDTDLIGEMGAKSETEVNYTLKLDCSAPECQIFDGRVVARGEYIHFNPFYTSETLYTIDCGDTEISTTPTDVMYNSTLGYGYLNGEQSTAWGEESYQSVREDDTTVQYRFDLDPDKVYQIELTFYDPNSSRNVSVYADGALLKANVELTDSPATITKKIEPQSIYSDGHIILEIKNNSGESAVVSEIKVSEIYKKQLRGIAGASVPIRVFSDVCPTPPEFEIPTWNMTIHYLPGGYTRVSYVNTNPCYLPTICWWGGGWSWGGSFTGKPISWSWSTGHYTPPASHPYHYTPPSYYYNPPSSHRHVPMPVPVEPLPPEIKEVTVHEIVRLYISQTATMELDALFAGLRMTNRMWDRSIDNIDIDINITDDQGNANDLFYINVLKLSNINDIGGSGVLDPLQTGAISWIIIPKVGAGGTDPEGNAYNVSADISYSVSGQPILHRTKPVQVVVLPSAQLTLDYYIPSEVKAYNPFKLAVKASNSGFGPAKSFEIETAQPVIYYNPSGLLIDFDITGSALNGVPRSNSLKVDFGDIGPQESKIAWWEMVTTLDGEFTEFTGKYTHSNEFGGTETSRIKDLRTYIIRRQVDTDTAFYDFLVDCDKDYVPDWVVSSSTGEAIDVLTVSYDVVFEPTVSEPVLEVNVTKVEGKWIYIPIDDPYDNKASVIEVRRSDGKVISPQNYWMQDGMIYLVDDPEENYEIVFNVSNLTQPDLTLSPEDISFSIQIPSAGETIIIDATVHNIGTADADNVTVQFFDNGMQMGSDQMIYSINAGGNETAQVSWTASSGSHNISVIVDPYGEIAESNETNNIAFRSIAVGRFTLSQNGNSWVIEPVIRDQSIVDFYDYRSASSHTGFEEPHISKIYLHQCNTSGELGLIIHHHKDAKSGSGSVRMDLQDVPADAIVAVADDRSSEFSLSQEPEGNWAYSENTDGGAITLPTNEPWSITVIPDFITGNSAWRLVNGGGNEIELDMEEPIVISYRVPAANMLWQYNCTTHIKENSGNDLTDYQVLINLSGSEFPVEANESGADIRFVDEYGNVLDYWIDEYSYSAKKAMIWVEVHEIPSNGIVTLQIYWGNPSASAMSDGDTTFEFFDDFGSANNWTYTETHSNLDGRVTPAYYHSYGHSYFIGGDGVDVLIPTGNHAQIHKTFSESSVAINAKLKTTTDYGTTGYAKGVVLNGDTELYSRDVYPPTGKFIEIESQVPSLSTLMLRLHTTAYDSRPSYWHHACYFDDIRIRKYVSPEPTVTIAP